MTVVPLSCLLPPAQATVSSYLNAGREEKLQAQGWLISAIPAKFNHLRGRELLEQLQEPPRKAAETKTKLMVITATRSKWKRFLLVILQ